jgi:hypothetical protein
MTIEVELVGPMRRPWPERQRTVQLAEGSVLGDLLASWGYREEEARHLSCSVNGVAARLRTRLVDGDRLSVALLLGGG